MFGRIERFFRLRGTEQRLFLQAYLIGGITSVLILIVPMRWCFKKLGEQGIESPASVPLDKATDVLLIDKAIRRALRYLPWRPKCFSRAITAKILLNRKNIPSTLYLGVAKKGQDKIIAHAWLRCGPVIVTGKEEMQRFTTVVFFT